MSEVVMSCVVCSPDLPAFTVPLTTEGVELLTGHLVSEHKGHWEHRPDNELVHVHRVGQIERGAWQWANTNGENA